MEGKTHLHMVLAVGLIVVAAILALNTTRTDDAQNALSVSGYFEQSVEPDKAELYLSIETVDMTAKLSQDKNSEISNAVIDSLVASGIKRSDIETDSYTIYPKEDWNDKESGYKLIGYTVMHTLKVTTSDIQNTGKYVDAAIDSGANRVDRVVFALTKEKERQIGQELLAKAGDNAKEKATSIAQNMGVRLGSIVSISESNYNIMPYAMDANTLNAGVGKLESQISPKYILASANIFVSYRI